MASLPCMSMPTNGLCGTHVVYVSNGIGVAVNGVWCVECVSNGKVQLMDCLGHCSGRW